MWKSPVYTLSKHCFQLSQVSGKDRNRNVPTLLLRNNTIKYVKSNYCTGCVDLMRRPNDLFLLIPWWCCSIKYRIWVLCPLIMVVIKNVVAGNVISLQQQSSNLVSTVFSDLTAPTEQRQQHVSVRGLLMPALLDLFHFHTTLHRLITNQNRVPYLTTTIFPSKYLTFP